MDRRNFLHLTAGTAVATLQGVAVKNALAATATRSTPEQAATDEDFWTAVRNEFTTDRTIINLNNGYASPAPRTVQDAMKRYLDYSNMGPYHTMIQQLEPRKETARRMIAEAAGCDPEEIAITRNSSESLEIAQLGIDLKPGDEVLTTNQDYPRMLTTFRQRERREGIKLKTISFPVPAISLDDLYQRVEQGVTPKTKVILVCHITNRTGQIFPIRRICDMAHARGIPVIVDGAHAFNQFPYRIDELNCDYYGVSLHKWTFAPIGTGFLYVRKSRIKQTWALMASSTRQDDDIRKFEEVGTHPAANFDAICEAMTFNQNIGIESQSRATALSSRPLGQRAGRQSQGEDPAQSESGHVLRHRHVRSEPRRSAQTDGGAAEPPQHLHRTLTARRVRGHPGDCQRVHHAERDRLFRQRNRERTKNFVG